MVNVTEAAKDELERMLASKGVESPDVALRLGVQAPGKFGLVLDREKEGDQVVTHDGTTVLLIEDDLSNTLEGVTIDCQATEEGTQLVIYRGQA